MTIFNRAHAGLVASGVLTLGLFFLGGPAVTRASPVLNEVMLSTARPANA